MTYNASQAVRTNMVETQLRPNRINEPALLEAFLNTPRERFVPPHLQALAYIDGPLNLTSSRVMLEPMVQARLLEVAGLKPASKVLLVGAGTGYIAALIAPTVASVIALEEDEGLYTQLAANIAHLDLKNVQALNSKLAEGAFAQGPFDAIIIEGAVAEVPASLIEQLAENGKLVGILVQPGKAGHIVVVERAGKFAAPVVRYDAEAPYLPGFAPVAKFEFS
jgi:protein-L-isoaspartate(D-aspartate) O-methyltransferase